MKPWGKLVLGVGLFPACLACSASSPSALGQPSQAAPACPDWTRHKTPPEYPSDQFYVGVGVKGGIYEASKGEVPGRSAAQTEIAQQVWSRVKSEIEVYNRSHNGSEQLSVVQHDYVSTSLVGPGARTVDTCFDWKNTTFYALAVLDKKEAAGRLAAELVSTNQRGADEVAAIERALSEGHPLEAVGSVGRAAALRSSYEQSAIMLRGLTSAQTPAAFASEGRLSELAEAVRGKTTVVITAKDPQGLFAPELAQSLSRKRIQVVKDEGQALVEVTGKVDSIRADFAPALRTYIAVARAELFIKRRDTGAQIGTVVREAKGGAPTQDLARRRAIQEAIKTAIPEMDKTLTPLLSVLSGPG